MGRPKKEEEETKEVKESLMIRVMDRETRKIIKIDANKENDWMTKYLHASGKEFE